MSRPVLLLLLLAAPAAAQTLADQAEQHMADGETAMSQADYPTAIAHFKAAVALASERPGPHVMLGLAYAAANQCSDAIPELELYLKLKKTNPRPAAVRALDDCKKRVAPPAPPPEPVRAPPPVVIQPVAPPPQPFYPSAPVYVPPPPLVEAPAPPPAEPKPPERWLPGMPAAGVGFRCPVSGPVVCSFLLHLAYDFIFGDAHFDLLAGGTSFTSGMPPVTTSVSFYGGVFGVDVGTPHFRLARFGAQRRSVTLAFRVGLGLELSGNTAPNVGTLIVLLNDYSLPLHVTVAPHVALFVRPTFTLGYSLAETGLPPGTTFRSACCGYTMSVLVGASFPLLER